MSFRERILEAPPAPWLTRLPWYEWLIVTVGCASGFLGQLDASIVQLALPKLADEFGVRVDDVRWVAIAYLLTYAALVAVVGQLSEILGRKLFFVAGFAIFAVGTALCGTASSIGWMVAFRVVQGVGGGLMGANSIAVMVTSIDGARRAQGVGLYTTAQAIGISAGPALGGVLLETLGWQWVFWVAVPPALAAAILGWLVLPPTVNSARDKRFDGPGALLLVPCVVLTIFSLNQVSIWPPASIRMLSCIAAAAVLFVLFVWRENAAPRPVVDLKLFTSVSFVAGTTGIVLGYALLYGMFFLMSFALLHGFHDRAMLAGAKLAVIPVAIGLIASPGIGIAKRRGARIVCVGGMGLSAAAILSLTVLADHPIGTLVTGLSSFAVFGMGLGLFIAPNNNATLDAAPASHSGQAAALLNLLRVLGSCIGVSAASSVMLWRMHQTDAFFGGRPLIDAAESSLGLLLIFALFAAGAAWLRPTKLAN